MEAVPGFFEAAEVGGEEREDRGLGAGAAFEFAAVFAAAFGRGDGDKAALAEAAEAGEV